MTEPAPPDLTEPLLTQTKLAVWAQESPLSDATLADSIIESVSVLLRLYGDRNWTMETIHPRARDIGYIVAKDYYINPEQLRQSTTGIIQQAPDNSVLNGLNFTDAQKAELASLADVTPDTIEGLFTMEITRGPVETHQPINDGTVYVYDTRGAWPIPYTTVPDGVVFQPEVV